MTTITAKGYAKLNNNQYSTGFISGVPIITLDCFNVSNRIFSKLDCLKMIFGLCNFLFSPQHTSALAFQKSVIYKHSYDLSSSLNLRPISIIFSLTIFWLGGYQIDTCLLFSLYLQHGFCSESWQP